MFGVEEWSFGMDRMNVDDLDLVRGSTGLLSIIGSLTWAGLRGRATAFFCFCSNSWLDAGLSISQARFS